MHYFLPRSAVQWRPTAGTMLDAFVRLTVITLVLFNILSQEMIFDYQIDYKNNTENLKSPRTE